MSQTVSLNVDDVIEAIAHLDAANSVFISLNGGTNSSIGDHFDVAAWGLYQDAFGEEPKEEGEYERDPRIVEIHARSAELAAEALSRIGLAKRVIDYKRLAEGIRRAGTISVPFGVDA